MNEEPTIGSIPARNFIGRQVKVRWNDSAPQPSICQVLGITAKGKITIQTHSGKNGIIEVEPKSVLPFWSRNPDLQKLAKTIPNPVIPDDSYLVSGSNKTPSASGEKEIVGKPQPVTLVPSKPKTEKQVVTTSEKTAEAKPTGVIKGIRAIDPAKPLGTEWMGDYEALQKASSGLAGKIAMVERLTREVKEDQEIMQLYVKELESKGVAIEWA